MPQDKVIPLREAVARFVPDGASVCMDRRCGTPTGRRLSEPLDHGA